MSDTPPTGGASPGSDPAEERRLDAVQEQHRHVSMAFRAIPVIFALVLAGNVGLLYFLGKQGGTAAGERVDIRLVGACARDAAPLVQGRVDTIGLGDPLLDVQADALVLTATLPGLDDDRTAVPALLTRRGLLEVRHGDRVLATRDDLVRPVLAMDEGGMPFNDLAFTPEATETLVQAAGNDPDGELVFVMDGEELARRPNDIPVEDGTLKVASGAGSTRERMRRVTDRHIVLLHGPLPCALTVAAVTPRPAAD